MAPARPLVRGDVWWFDPDPVVGREQGAKVRPGVIVSANALNQGPGELIVVVPCTTHDRNVPLHVPIAPPDGGLPTRSLAMCDQVRAISTQRLRDRLGRLAPTTLAAIDDALRITLDL